MKILFLIPYPLQAVASQRFRFEQYVDTLSKKGWKLHFQPFINSHNWHFFSKSGKNFQKLAALIKGFGKRFFVLCTVGKYDFVFIHRETLPLGPPILEWIIFKIFKKRIIYDFDDAIWLTDRKHESFFLRSAKWRSKVSFICRWSHKVSCGNRYLGDYARQFNLNVVCVPTTIDTQYLHNPRLFPEKEQNDIVIGWTGSHSTLKYLDALEDVLQKLEKKYNNLKILVIADQPPSLSLETLEFIPWSTDVEMTSLVKMNIGIMPLPDDEWSKGKCGFKALQYMAMEIATVASPVGVNTSIIDHGVNGFLCRTDEEWTNTLETLIKDAGLRRRIGMKGREKVIGAYSVLSNTSTFLSLFE